jgi:hypothetical protein
MKSTILFQEKQQFRQWWLWLLLTAITGFLFLKTVLWHDYGNMNSTTMLFPLTIMALVVLLFWFIKLETKIAEEGIYVSFFPLLLATKFYSWEKIENAFIKKYNPILDYGGWGIRMGAYNVSGNMGLQLEFKNGNKLLIGTQKAEEIQIIVNNRKSSLFKNTSK